MYVSHEWRPTQFSLSWEYSRGPAPPPTYTHAITTTRDLTTSALMLIHRDFP